jgi:hypothetical protein
MKMGEVARSSNPLDHIYRLIQKTKISLRTYYENGNVEVEGSDAVHHIDPPVFDFIFT